MTLCSREKKTISENNSLILDYTFFYSVRAFAHIRQTLLLKILGDGCMGRPPPQNFLGDSPQSPLGLRPCFFYSRGLRTGPADEWYVSALYKLRSIMQYDILYYIGYTCDFAKTLPLQLLNEISLSVDSHKISKSNHCQWALRLTRTGSIHK